MHSLLPGFFYVFLTKRIDKSIFTVHNTNETSFFFFLVPLFPSKTILSDKKGEQVFLVMPLEKKHKVTAPWSPGEVEK